MKDWINHQIKLINANMSNVIIFPSERRQNQIEEYRENQRKMSELKNNDLIIKLTSRDEAANVYKVTFPKPAYEDYDDFGGDSPKSA